MKGTYCLKLLNVCTILHNINPPSEMFPFSAKSKRKNVSQPKNSFSPKKWRFATLQSRCPWEKTAQIRERAETSLICLDFSRGIAAFLVLDHARNTTIFFPLTTISIVSVQLRVSSLFNLPGLLVDSRLLNRSLSFESPFDANAHLMFSLSPEVLVVPSWQGNLFSLLWHI